MLDRALLSVLACIALIPGTEPVQDGVFDATPAGLRVEPDQDNVVAGRLRGTWEPDSLVNERLGNPVTDTHELGVSGPRTTYVFEPDPLIAQKIPAAYTKFLGKLQLFDAGVFTIREDARMKVRMPYVLIVHNGNMHVMTFRERDGHAFGDAESGLVNIALGKGHENDLLLLGGDFANEPFSAFRRVRD